MDYGGFVGWKAARGLISLGESWTRKMPPSKLLQLDRRLVVVLNIDPAPRISLGLKSMPIRGRSP